MYLYLFTNILIILWMYLAIKSCWLDPVDNEFIFFQHWHFASYLIFGGVTQNRFLQSAHTAPTNPCKPGSLSSRTVSISQKTTRKSYNQISSCPQYLFAGIILKFKNMWSFCLIVKRHTFIISYIPRSAIIFKKHAFAIP